MSVNEKKCKMEVNKIEKNYKFEKYEKLPKKYLHIYKILDKRTIHIS